MTPIPADWDACLRQSGHTQAHFLDVAQKDLDLRFGVGFSLKHPDLVLRAAQSMHYAERTMVFAKLASEYGEGLFSQLERLAGSLDGLGEAIGEVRPPS